MILAFFFGTVAIVVVAWASFRIARENNKMRETLAAMGFAPLADVHEILASPVAQLPMFNWNGARASSFSGPGLHFLKSAFGQSYRVRHAFVKRSPLFDVGGSGARARLACITHTRDESYSQAHARALREQAERRPRP